MFFAVHWCNETITNIITIIKSWQRQKWFSELYSTHDDMQILIVRLSQQKQVLNIVNNIKIRIFSSTLCNGNPQNKLVKNIPYKTQNVRKPTIQCHFLFAEGRYGRPLFGLVRFISPAAVPFMLRSGRP